MVAGETDIEQLGRVIATFGSMEGAWPGVKELPDYGKISFAACQGYPLEELLPDASSGSVKLLKRLLKLDPGRLYWSMLTRVTRCSEEWVLPTQSVRLSQILRLVDLLGTSKDFTDKLESSVQVLQMVSSSAWCLSVVCRG